MKLKHVLTAVVLSAFGILMFENLAAHSSGMTGVTLKPGSSPGCTCHGSSPTTSVLVNIIGPASMNPGDTALFMLKIKGGPLAAAGCDIASSSGSLITSSAESFLQRVAVGSGFELTHNSPKVPTPDTVTFKFRFIAPNTPNTTVTLYANGNSVNLNSSSTGDNWNYAANKTITITTTSIHYLDETVKGYELGQNYPNPFNPSTNIIYSVSKTGFVTLKVYNLAGQEVATLVNGEQNSGTYLFDFKAGDYNLSSGIYLYKLSSGDFTEVKKMILAK